MIARPKIPEQPVGEGSEALVELTAKMDPGNSSLTPNAKLVIWNGTEYKVTKDTLALTDPLYQNFGIGPIVDGYGEAPTAGERFKAKWHPATNRWECIGSQGLRRHGKADAEITVDGSALVSIWTGADGGSDSTENVTAHLRWMHGNSVVSLGKEVVVQYYTDAQQWHVDLAECE